MAKTSPTTNQEAGLLRIVRPRIEAHPKSRTIVDVGPFNFVLLPEVFDPSTTISSRISRQCIAKIPKNKVVLDMGCGTGMLGIAAHYSGAKHVVLSDVNPHSVRNARENVALHDLHGRVEVVQSNVFDGLRGRRFDVILFNMPFLAPNPAALSAHIKSTHLINSFFDPGYKVMNRFFEGIAKHTTRGGYAQVSFSNLGDIDRFESLLADHSLSKKAIFHDHIEGMEWFIYRLSPRRRRSRR